MYRRFKIEVSEDRPLEVWGSLLGEREHFKFETDDLFFCGRNPRQINRSGINTYFKYDMTVKNDFEIEVEFQTYPITACRQCANKVIRK